VPDQPIDIVLFDVGGVLVDFGGVDPMRALARIDSDDELWRRWLTCPWVRRFERGHCSPDDFAAGMVDTWHLAISPPEFLASFESWPGAPMEGAAELLGEAQRARPTGCLSNTNALHWESCFAHWPLFAGFAHRFLSFEMGMVKPDPEIYDAVAASLAVAPGRILFLDDNVLNVEAAASAGFQAVGVRGPQEARHELEAAGVISR
jgi:glucose-1-phosphatase